MTQSTIDGFLRVGGESQPELINVQISETIIAQEAIINNYLATQIFNEPQVDQIKDAKKTDDDLEIERMDKARRDKFLAQALAADEARQEKNKFTKKIKNIFDKMIVRQVTLGLGVALILGSTGYLSVNIWQTNEQSLEVSAKTSITEVKKDESNNQPVFAQGVNAEPLPANALSNYQVAPDQPRAIYINKINVSARILPMGVNEDGSLQSPVNSYDAGWYNASGKPGQDGAMLVDGHGSETGTYYGLFGYISTLNPGDQITIERGDGTRLNYIVANKEIVPLADVDMSKMLVPYGSASQGLNLISCTGEWTSDHTTLDHRVMIYAILQG